ncbi:hypothetical protein MNB_SV-6-5 [hydrothermal vent metagenome]|uniref:Uncharacterized protein n=1 Tax=hydrothermal vent metagenome TaxID=652676 RepID=A0A1W1BHE5_9ZZZZ
MNILYVKSNSERDKRYQIQTIVYEEDGERFVKKKALCREANRHISNMRESYYKLSDSIVDTNISLAKIVKEESDALTFEFVDGISMESKILRSIKDGTLSTAVDEYMKLISNGFETIKTAPDGITAYDGKRIFGNIDFAPIGSTLCFKSISNIDLIFSNIIYRDGVAHIIDYEWVFDGSVPLKYSLYRAFRSLHEIEQIDMGSYFSRDELAIYETMERRFIYFEVTNGNSFYQYRDRYEKYRPNLYELKSTQESDILKLSEKVATLENNVDELEDETIYYSLSRSWKITRPMRKFFTYLRGLR